MVPVTSKVATFICPGCKHLEKDSDGKCVHLVPCTAAYLHGEIDATDDLYTRAYAYVDRNSKRGKDE